MPTFRPLHPSTLVATALLVCVSACSASRPAESRPAYAAHSLAEASADATEGVPDPDHLARDGGMALNWLLDGNARYALGRPRHNHESLMRRAHLVDGQRPFAVVVGCSDSRVIPELIFDHGLGDLFVIRVAGNVVAEDEAGSIEYAVDHLGVPLVVILGHETCGAVTAALDTGVTGPASELSLLRRIRPALAEIDPTLPFEMQVRLGVEANVGWWVRMLEDIAEREHVREHNPGLEIVGGVYDLRTGRVRILDIEED